MLSVLSVFYQVLIPLNAEMNFALLELSVELTLLYFCNLTKETRLELLSHRLSTWITVNQETHKEARNVVRGTKGKRRHELRACKKPFKLGFVKRRIMGKRQPAGEGLYVTR